jgi:hypothetical protein
VLLRGQLIVADGQLADTGRGGGYLPAGQAPGPGAGQATA